MIMWSNGKFVKENKVSTLNWSLHYGSTVWEGIRSYKLQMNKTAQLFSLTAHIDRLFDSAKMLKMEIPYTRQEIMEACREVQRQNGNKELYFRPVVYLTRDAENDYENLTVGVDIHVMKLQNMYPKTGIRVTTSQDPRGYPAFWMQCKSSNNYGRLNLMQDAVKQMKQKDSTFVVDNYGHYVEGSTANIFIFKNNTLLTPPNNGSILPGITRKWVLDQFGGAEKQLTKPDLITADEIFITGTYAEITPVIEFDGYKIGDGTVGPMTDRIRKAYLHAVRNPLWNGIFGQ